MIVSLTTHHNAASKKDAEALQNILEALGVWRGRPRPRGKQDPKRDHEFLSAPATLRISFDAKPAKEPTLHIQVSELLLAFQIVKKCHGASVAPSSEEEIASQGFQAKLPSGATVEFTALSPNTIGAELPGISGSLLATGKRFGIVVSRFNAFITERLLQGAYDALLRSGAVEKNITIVRVPGAFEIPSAARTLAKTGKHDAIVCLGCLLRGDTAHYDVIVNEVTRGIGQSAQETGVPHAFGVLTCDTLEQAIDRSGLKMGNKGLEAAIAAIEMASLQKTLARKSPKKKSRR
jgi:6,7-dimethyl-8-ribityllumazine synthase